MSNGFLEKSYLHVKENGLYSLLQLAFMRLRISPNGLLQRIYGFNTWHINPYSKRPYAKAIVSHLNKRSARQSVLEIGCGLGDILRRLDFKNKKGLDREQAVLNAAAFMTKFHNASNGTVSYKIFDLLDDEINGTFEAIIMVNWIHEIPPQILAEKFNTLFTAHLKPGGELIFDVLDNPDYKYNHSPNELTSGINADLSLIGRYDYNRHVYSARKTELNSAELQANTLF